MKANFRWTIYYERGRRSGHVTWFWLPQGKRQEERELIWVKLSKDQRRRHNRRNKSTNRERWNILVSKRENWNWVSFIRVGEGYPKLGFCPMSMRESESILGFHPTSVRERIAVVDCWKKRAESARKDFPCLQTTEMLEGKGIADKSMSVDLGRGGGVF